MRRYLPSPHRAYLLLAVPFVIGTELQAAPSAPVPLQARQAPRPFDTVQRRQAPRPFDTVQRRQGPRPADIAQQRTTPSVLRLSVDSARQVLERAKLRLQLIGSVPFRAPPGTIVRQIPGPGAPTPRDNVVHVQTAAAPEDQPSIAIMPDVRGRMLPDAAQVLRRIGVRVGPVDSAQGLAPPGTVIGQRPDPGDTLRRGTVAALTIAASRLSVVPTLVGRTPADAERTLRSAGLALGAVTDVPSASASDLVLRQDPLPQTQVPPGSPVQVSVARRIALVPVPNVIGEPYESARRILAQRNLGASRAGWVESDAAAETVVSQTPTAGSKVSPRSTVQLVLTRPPRFVLVPNVIDRPLPIAIRMLRGAELRVTRVDSIRSTRRADTVVDQSPPPGSRALPGSIASLVVAVPPAAVLVPNVVNRPVAIARALIRRAGLTPARLDTSDVVRPDTVVEQTPAAGSPVMPGASVSLTVGGVAPVVPPQRRQDSATVPSVLRERLADARRLVAAERLRVDVSPSATAPDGAIVAAQQPAAGTRVLVGTTVRLRLTTSIATAPVVGPATPIGPVTPPRPATPTETPVSPGPSVATGGMAPTEAQTTAATTREQQTSVPRGVQRRDSASGIITPPRNWTWLLPLIIGGLVLLAAAVGFSASRRPPVDSAHLPQEQQILPNPAGAYDVRGEVTGGTPTLGMKVRRGRLVGPDIELRPHAALAVVEHETGVPLIVGEERL
jgi:beta-lactam-binding protein with PASTA domain